MPLFKTSALATLAAVATLVGATAGHASSAQPVFTCGQTVTTSVYLTQDLYCTGDGIVVGAPGVTIDLKGYTLNGDRDAGDYGIDDSGGLDSVTIKNGAVRNFEIGVNARPFAHDIIVTGVAAGGNAKTGIYIDGANASVQKSDASGNNLHGIDILGSNAKIQSSTAAGNLSVGIKVKGDSASVALSVAAGNLAYGIAIYGDFGVVKQSTASGNGEQGILLQGSSAMIKGNHADGNGFAGGVSDVDGSGIFVSGFAVAPLGTNDVHANDNFVQECEPYSLC